MGEIDQRVVRLVVDTLDEQILPDQRATLAEDLLATFRKIDVADLHRPGLAARDRTVGGVLEPVALFQAVDDRAVEIGDMAGNTLDLGVGDSFDDDVVADPVDANLADHLGGSEAMKAEQQEGGGKNGR